MTYYITKYALTNGGKIEVRNDSDVECISERTVYFKKDWSSRVLWKDVFTDEAEAKKAVLAARNKKIASLEKQIAKLRKIEVSK